MGWKREQFKRRIRELAAATDGSGRAYVPLQDAENDIAYSFDYVWHCLAKAWAAGHAMGKSPLTLQDEVEAWLADMSVRQPRVISQAFLDTRVGHRVWNSKCEMSRFEIASAVLSRSELGAERKNDELQEWYSDIVAEWADLYKTTSLPDANHAIVNWAETAALLPRLWSLYERGPRTMEDRTTLKALVVEVANVSDQQAEAWVSAEEARREEAGKRCFSEERQRAKSK